MIVKGTILKRREDAFKNGFSEMYAMCGDTFKVTSVLSDGTITVETDIGCGIMDADTANKFFRVLNKVEETNRWSMWYAIDGSYMCRTDGKFVQVRKNGSAKTTAVAICHEDDKFDFATGIKIAMLRSKIKSSTKETEKLKAELQEVLLNT